MQQTVNPAVSQGGNIPEAAMQPRLVYFRPREFGDWWNYLSPRLLVMADIFRHRWHDSCTVRFPHDDEDVGGRLGRHLGDSNSLHNVDKWGAVLAMDLFPAGMDTRPDMERAIRLAKELGFTGIGIYPQWKPSPGLHLDVRDDRKPGSPSMWGAVRAAGAQKYVSTVIALEAAT